MAAVRIARRRSSDDLSQNCAAVVGVTDRMGS
jgi:hypothetical protein